MQRTCVRCAIYAIDGFLKAFDKLYLRNAINPFFVKPIKLISCLFFVIVTFCAGAQKLLGTLKSISNITAVESTLFFVGDDGSGPKLWMSNGQPGGMSLVLNNEGSSISNPDQLIAFKGVLYFSAYTLQYGTELWKSDGTSEGTFMVKDINTQGSSYPHHFKPFKDFLYFSASLDNVSTDLYRTDGTSIGTTFFNTLNYNSGNEIVASSKFLYFLSEAGSKTAVVQTDGTIKNTTISNDEDAASKLIATENGVFYITSSSYYQDVKLYFLSNESTTPQLLAEFKAPLYGSQEIDNFCIVGNNLFFSLRTDDDISPTDVLWCSDGTVNGTKSVKSFAWSRYEAYSGMKYFISYHGNLFFWGGSPVQFAFWKSDGTNAGTQAVSTAQITAPMYQENPPVISNGNLFFSGNSGLWISDGTANGTKEFFEIDPGQTSLPHDLCDANGTLVFVATGETGPGLWSNQSGPEILIQSGPINFYTVGVTGCTKTTVSINNIGNKELLLDSVTISGKDFFIQGKVPFMLMPQEKSSFDLIFQPIVSEQRDAILTIRSNDQQRSIINLQVTGIGVESTKQTPCKLLTDHPSKVIKPTLDDRKILLSNPSVREKLPPGTVVGTLSIPEATTEFSFSLIQGEGDWNNNDFELDGDKLKTTKAFIYDSTKVCSIRIRATGNSSAVEDWLLITITDTHTVDNNISCPIVRKSMSFGWNGVAVDSRGYVYAVGEGGNIIRSKDEGATWNRLNSGVSIALSKIKFINGRGYISGQGVLLKSDDNGDTWFQLDTPLISDYVTLAFHFVDESLGFASGSNGKLIKTKDGGRTWSVLNSGIFETQSIWFWDENNGIVFSQTNDILKTTDGGKSWTTVSTSNLDFDPQFSSVWFIDKKKGFVTGSRSLYETTDGGDHWSPVPAVTADYFTGVKFIDDKTGYALGGWYGSILYRTTNGGDSWENLVSSAITLAAGPITDICSSPLTETLFLSGHESSLGSSQRSGQIIASSNTKGDSWTTLSQLKTDESFSELFFTSEDVAYLLGNYDVFKTVNNGLSWKALNMNRRFNDIHFFDDQTGLLSDATTIYRTTNGGVTISPVFTTDNSNTHSVPWFTFVNSMVGFAYGGLIIEKTTDGGLTWFQAGNAPPEMRALQFISEQVGYAIDYEGTTYKSTNGGITWSPVYTSPPNADLFFNTLYFFNENEGLKGGYNGLLYKTTNGGVTWTRIYGNVQGDIGKMLFINSLEGFILIGQSTIYKTLDGGKTWQFAYQDGSNVTGISWKNSTLYIVGSDGMVDKLAPESEPTQPSYIAGDSMLCVGDNGSYHVVDAGQGQYQWSASAPLHGDHASALVQFTAPGTYEVTVRYLNGCGVSPDRPLSVNVNDLAAVIIGPDTVNLGQQGLEYAIQDAGKNTMCHWNIAGAATSSTTSASSISVDWSRTEKRGQVTVFAIDQQSACRARDTLNVVALQIIAGAKNEVFPVVQIYPNPTADQIVIQTGSRTDLSARVIDVSGREFLSSRKLGGETDIISFQNFPSGLYVIEISDSNGKQSGYRIIKR